MCFSFIGESQIFCMMMGKESTELVNIWSSNFKIQFCVGYRVAFLLLFTNEIDSLNC